MGKAVGRQRGFGEAGAQPAEESHPGGAPAGGGVSEAGRAAYERELARALRDGAPSARRLAELPEGGYGLRLLGDDGSQGLGLLSVRDGRLQLELPLDEDPFTRVEMPLPVDGAVALELERSQGEARLRLAVRGEALVRPGCVSVDLRISGSVEHGEARRLVRRRLKGSADLRFGLA